MTIAPTKVGRRTFLGNSAVVPAGTTIGENSLLGVLTVPPCDPGKAGERGSSWHGGPPVRLPHREPSGGFSAHRTYRPTRRGPLVRAIVDAVAVNPRSASCTV